jgi:ribulose-phosphate 3-epimerase
MRSLIAPSILAADFACLGDEVRAVIAAGADWIHFDVMDQHYVPNLTVGPAVAKALKPHCGAVPLDVHLMVQPVDALAEAFAHAGANVITFHPEASLHVDRTLQLIGKLGCQAGLAFNPATPLDVLEHVIERVDLVLIMSVNPGWGGQSFIESSLRKIAAARRIIDASGRAIRLQVDGGITAGNIGRAAAAGADVFVAGSAVFDGNGTRTAGSAGDYRASIGALRSALAPRVTEPA